MCAVKGKCSNNMFHIKFPAQRHFLSWAELACLARALGFPQDLFRRHVNDEVEFDDKGISIWQLQRMTELKLLHYSLQHTYNVHTADWNMAVVWQALKYLHLHVFSFEEIHDIRMAYSTYEAPDVKGLSLQQRTLLRTLKMCNRVISPLKLTHRVKHMRAKLEEPNRIQLYEFFDLILWCERKDEGQLVTDKQPCVTLKNRDLYELADFEMLLSHEDERQSRALDERYLAEEWDFGQERLGGQDMFKGEVVQTHQRLSQTHKQKRKYRHLKKAVNQSQRRVFTAHAGTTQNRPISAPDTSSWSCDSAASRAPSAADMYNTVQRRLHSAPSRASKVDVSDRPCIPNQARVQSPSVVTSDDIEDVQAKMQSLHFDIITLESRCQKRKEEERNIYLPHFQPTSTRQGDVQQLGKEQKSMDNPSSTETLSSIGKTDTRSSQDSGRHHKTTLPFLQSIVKLQESSQTSNPNFRTELPKDLANGKVNSSQDKDSTAGSEDSGISTGLAFVAVEDSKHDANHITNDVQSQSEVRAGSLKICKKSGVSVAPAEGKRVHILNNTDREKRIKVTAAKVTSAKVTLATEKTRRSLSTGCKTRERQSSASRLYQSSDYHGDRTSTPLHLPLVAFRPDDWKKNASCKNNSHQHADTFPDLQFHLHDDQNICTSPQGSTTNQNGKRNVQFFCPPENDQECLNNIANQTPDQSVKKQDPDQNQDLPKFVFSAETTRRLLNRVRDIISVELLTQIQTGSNGLNGLRVA